MKINALRIAVSVAVVAIGASFAACGIDESGLLGDDASNGVDVIITTDSGPPDVIIDVIPNDGIPPPPSCSTDASADVSCIPPVPLGWEPIAFKNGNVGCGDDGGDFTSAQYLTQPTITKTSCVCSNCFADGGWTCNASIHAGNTCSTDTLDVDASSCWSISHGSFGGSVTRSGSPTCGGGSALGDNGADAATVSACYPKQCSSDFCGLSNSGYTLCVANALVTDGGCPGTFPNGHIVGSAAHTACDTCGACTLTNPTATCSGILSAFNSNDCSGTNTQVAVINGSCDGTNSFTSLGIEAGIAAPSCGTSKAVSGVPYLDGPFTICCP